MYSGPDYPIGTVGTVPRAYEKFSTYENSKSELFKLFFVARLISKNNCCLVSSKCLGPTKTLIRPCFLAYPSTNAPTELRRIYQLVIFIDC